MFAFLMVASVESRFGRVNRSPQTIEWLSDNGSGYIARETRAFAREIGPEPFTTPVTRVTRVVSLGVV